MENLTELSFDEENKVEILAGSLYRRVGEETERLLRDQLAKLGHKFQEATWPDEYHALNVIGKLKKIIYPTELDKLCTYEYDGKTILGVRIGPNGMSIIFDVPEIETQEVENGE